MPAFKFKPYTWHSFLRCSELFWVKSLLQFLYNVLKYITVFPLCITRINVYQAPIILEKKLCKSRFWMYTAHQKSAPKLSIGTEVKY